MQRDRSTSSRRRRGFTLVELLIVIGIIALLIGLLIPVISMVTRSGRRTVTAATLSSISSALENYHADFDDYPRFQPDPDGENPLNTAEDRGARLLARVLIGVAPQTSSAGTGDEDYLFQDGHGTLEQPFGWKERRQTITRGGDSGEVFPGQVYGPYLDADSFNVRKSDLPDYTYGPDAVLLDDNDMPILYYPARRKTPDINTEPGGTGTSWDPTGFVADQGYEYAPGALFNAYDNFGEIAEERLQVILGDTDNDGRIGAGETAASTGPFLLIATGTDGTFEGDVVANFDPAE